MTRARKISLAFAAALLLVGGGFWWLVASESGLRFVWARARAFAPFPLAGEAHGALLGPLRIDALQLDLPRARVTAASAEIDWVPAGLLQGRLLFTRVDVRELKVVVKPASGPPRTTPPRIPAPRLPLEVRGQVAGLTVEFTTTAATRQIHFDRVAVDGVAGPATLKLRKLLLEGYGAQLESGGEIALRLDGPVRLATRWSYQPPAGERIRGHGTLTGTLARPRTDQSLDAVLHGSARGSLIWLDQPLQWRAEASADPVDLTHLHRGAYPLLIGGRFNGDGSGDHLHLAGSGSARERRFGGWNFQFDAQRAGAAWQIAELALTAQQGTGRVTASGLLHTDGAAAVEGEVAWDALTWPGGTERFVSPSGRVTVQGSLDRYRVVGNAVLARAGLPDGAADLEGVGDRASFTVTRLRAAWLGGEVSGVGRVHWSPNLAWSAELQARGINPGEWRAEWPGAMAANLVTRGERRNRRWQAEVTLTDLGGTLRGRPLAGHARVALDDARVRVDSLLLQSGSARVTAQGEVDARWALEWEVTAERIEDLLPQAAGRFAAHGDLSGPRATPRVRVSASGDDLRWRERRAGRLALAADVDLAGDTPWDLRLDASDLIAARGIAFDQLTVGGHGTPAQHQLTLDAQAVQRALHLEARGAYADQRWQGELFNGRADDPLLGQWSQSAVTPLIVGRNEVRLANHCWGREGASICAELAGGADQPWSGAAQLHAFPVAALRPWLREGFGVTGLLDGHARFQFRDQLQSFDLDLAATDGAFSFQPSSAEAIITPYARVALTGSADGRGAQARLGVELTNGDHLRADAALPAWRPGAPFAATQPVRGSADASLGELVWVSLLAPELVATGRLETRLALSGTLGQPLVQGNAALVNGELALPRLGIALADLTAEARAEGAAMALSAGARSGAGRLQVNGRLLRDAEAWTLALAAKGDNVELARLPQARIVASPDLQLELRNRVIHLRGSVLVPEARLVLPEITAPVQASPDVIIVDRPNAEPRARRWSVISEVEVRFGDDVRLTGYGLAGRLGGAIVVVEPEGGGAVGRGELQILDGKYTAYGQELTIEEGRLLYGNAPINNPGIDFRATREVQQVTVGVTATGRLKKPEVRLYSQPAMDDTQVLAYLVLGRGLEEATKEESDVLQRAALSLGVVGGNELARQIGAQAGLDVINLQASTQPAAAATTTPTTTTGTTTGTATGTTATPAATGPQYQASLVLGKYLSPRLYVQYAVGLWESDNAWQMRYLLDRNWTLKAQSGLQSGVDLLYTIEK